MQTVTKKDVAKRTAKALNEKIYTTEKFVDSIFTVLREILSEANHPTRSCAHQTYAQRRGIAGGIR